MSLLDRTQTDLTYGTSITQEKRDWAAESVQARQVKAIVVGTMRRMEELMARSEMLAEMLEEDALVKSLVGLTVTSARAYDDNDEEWDEHGRAELTFSDGRIIRFSGWGYDAYGVHVTDISDPV